MTALKMIESHFDTRQRAQSCRCDPIQKHKISLFRNMTVGQRRTSDVDEKPINPKKNFHPYIQRKLDNVGKNIRYIERSMKKTRQTEELAADWQFVAMVIDRCMLIFFSITISIGTLIATTSAPSLHDTRLPVNRNLFPFLN